jgi:hypothetical protein
MLSVSTVVSMLVGGHPPTKIAIFDGNLDCWRVLHKPVQIVYDLESHPT